MFCATGMNPDCNKETVHHKVMMRASVLWCYSGLNESMKLSFEIAQCTYSKRWSTTLIDPGAFIAKEHHCVHETMSVVALKFVWEIARLMLARNRSLKYKCEYYVHITGHNNASTLFSSCGPSAFKHEPVTRASASFTIQTSVSHMFMGKLHHPDVVQSHVRQGHLLYTPVTVYSDGTTHWCLLHSSGVLRCTHTHKQGVVTLRACQRLRDGWESLTPVVSDDGWTDIGAGSDFRW